MRRLFVHRNLALGVVLCAVLVGMALTSLLWTPHDGNQMSPGERLEGPSFSHPMGTDQYGRDTLSRVMTGAVRSLSVGLVAVTVGLSLGLALGLVAGHRGKLVEEGIMRGCDFLFSFPAVLTAILLTAVRGPSLGNATLAIGIFYVPVFARLTRAVTRTILAREFIAAARSAGTSEWGITWRHVLPNLLSTLLIQATIQFAVAILAEAGLSYLGLGIQPPDASWGRMLNEAQTFLSLSPWMALFPGLAIAWTVLGFNLLGDGLRDTLDRRT